MHGSRSISPLGTAGDAGDSFVRSTAFEVLSRAGFVARALVYAFTIARSFARLVGQQVREMGREVPMGRLVGLLALVDQVHRLDRLPRLVLGLGPVVFFRSRLGRKNSKRTAISRNGM